MEGTENIKISSQVSKNFKYGQRRGRRGFQGKNQAQGTLANSLLDPL